MLKEELEKRKFCRELRKRVFFDDVSFRNERLQKYVEAWFWDLAQEKELYVTKFKELLDNSLEFPVKIYGKRNSKCIELCIVDINEKICQMCLFRKNFTREFQKYSIGQYFCCNCKSDKKFYKETILEIEKNPYKGSKPIGASVSMAGGGENVEIAYSSDVNVIELNTKERKFIISYPREEHEIDENCLASYLLGEVKDEVNNVLTIFKKNIGNVQSTKNIVISGIKGDLVNSILEIDMGKVVNYSYTEIVDANRSINTRLYPCCTIDEFLSEH